MAMDEARLMYPAKCYKPHLELCSGLGAVHPNNYSLSFRWLTHQSFEIFCHSPIILTLIRKLNFEAEHHNFFTLEAHSQKICENATLPIPSNIALKVPSPRVHVDDEAPPPDDPFPKEKPCRHP